MDKKMALLVIDVQVGMFEGGDILYKETDLIDTVNVLIGKARVSNAPIIFVQHNDEGEDGPLSPNTDGWSIHPALQVEEDDICIQKRHPDSFQETDLQTELTSRGIKTLVIAGLQTEYCIDTTCRSAYSRGYDVVLVENGHSTYDRKSRTAAQIIAHHNDVLGSWFVSLQNSARISFGN